ncbi:hypothetical protein GYMLUDRAFT_376167 [Collybiopsis luxurians FD-317 M1]|uniref:Uncharacterized protein n=1 Tax=Collybiopsis luxurians FD-317 M1 TaxID=944289 RepID=A0A0D0BQR1_9AGAR|nr:hypothetical protein GYMLUDRAFT_376167 [Collybiopsis luxurians FD-317 M1]
MLAGLEDQTAKDDLSNQGRLDKKSAQSRPNFVLRYIPFQRALNFPRRDESPCQTFRTSGRNEDSYRARSLAEKGVVFTTLSFLLVSYAMQSKSRNLKT